MFPLHDESSGQSVLRRGLAVFRQPSRILRMRPQGSFQLVGQLEKMLAYVVDLPAVIRLDVELCRARGTVARNAPGPEKRPIRPAQGPLLLCVQAHSRAGKSADLVCFTPDQG